MTRYCFVFLLIVVRDIGGLSIDSFMIVSFNLLKNFTKQVLKHSRDSVKNIDGVNWVLFHGLVLVKRILNIEKHLVVSLCQTLKIVTKFAVDRLLFCKHKLHLVHCKEGIVFYCHFVKV